MNIIQLCNVLLCIYTEKVSLLDLCMQPQETLILPRAVPGAALGPLRGERAPVLDV